MVKRSCGSLLPGKKNLVIVDSRCSPVTTVLTGEAGDFVPPTLSPDGSKIAFVDYRAGGTRIVSRTGQAIATASKMIATDWTPDGRLVLVGFGINPGVFLVSTDFHRVTKISSQKALWGKRQPGRNSNCLRDRLSRLRYGK